MRVLYDASLLGTVHGTSGSRAGIFRVADTLARLLLESPDCEARLGAAHSAFALYNLVAYVHTQKGMENAPFACRAPFDRSIPLRHELARLEARPRLSPADRLRRSLLYRSIQRMESGAGEGDFCDYRGYDVYHSPYFPLPELEATGGRRGPRRLVTIYDLIPILHPEFYRKLPDQIDMIPSIIRSVGPEDWVLTISESTRRDLLGYRPDLDPERVVVTELAASDRFYPHRDPEEARAIRARYGVPEAPYFLSVATLEPRKNLQHVVRCFARWTAQEKVDDVNLVLVGEKGWGYEELMAEIETLGPLRDRVIVTGRAEDEHLAALYSGGLAFAYLSHYEGFGLPPLEAMQCGVPVITSDRSSLPEVVGDAGLLLDPEDTDGLCAAFDRVWKDDDLRARMAAASLERARRFSWRRCLEDTLAAYRRAAAS